MRNKLQRRRRQRTLALGLVSLACAALAAWGIDSPRVHARQGPSGARREAEPKATVYGRVVYEGGDRPVRRARIVMLSAEKRGPEPFGVTDARGEFRLRGVAAGRHLVAVDAPGIISPVSFAASAGLGDSLPDFDEMAKHFDVFETDGKADKEVTVRARRGGALGGRVSYADGSPAAGLSVQVMRKREGSFARTLTGLNIAALTGARTDDRGAYRVSGLPPGEYVVAVAEAAEHVEAGVDDGEMLMARMAQLGGLIGHQLFTTFHPSATSAKEATVIKVEAGDEREGVDITVAERAARVLSGVVRGRGDKRPVARAKVSITPRGREGAAAAYTAEVEEFLQDGVFTDEEGRWRLKEIPDGSYIISVKPPEGRESETLTAADVSDSLTNSNRSYESRVRRRRVQKYAPTSVEVEVSGDVLDLPIELAEGGRVSGTVGIEGGKPLPKYSHVHATRVGRDASGRGGAPSSVSVEGGQFSMDGLSPGKYYLNASVAEPEGGLYVKSIKWRGRDLLREPLEIGESTVVEGVEIVYSADPAILKVSVRPASGQAAGRALYVFLAPANLAGWSPHSGQQFYCSTHAGETCDIKAAPGEYSLIVMRTASIKGDFDEEVRRRAAHAPRITLRAGETKTFEADAPER